jgi:hypothetical protein
VEADPKQLIAAKSAKSHPPSFVFGESKVTADLIKEYEAADFFLLAMVALLLMNKSLLPKPMKSSCFATSLHADSDSLVILFFLQF